MDFTVDIFGKIFYTLDTVIHIGFCDTVIFLVFKCGLSAII